METMTIRDQVSMTSDKHFTEFFHAAIDDQLERRENSLNHAVNIRDTGMQWDLVTAAVEAAVIKTFDLGKEEAGNVRGRSRITFSNKLKKDAARHSG